LGGFATLALLWWLFLSGSSWAHSRQENSLNGYCGLALLGTAILVCQIALGGWTSANYAAAACPDFPTCQSQWWPQMDFREAFVLWRGLDIHYEFGVLDNPARTGIHVAHRIGALVTAIYLLGLCARLLFKVRDNAVRAVCMTVLVLTVSQVGLGIANVVLGWPLSMAAAHNATAALLLLAMLALNFLLKPTPRPSATYVSVGAATRQKGATHGLI
jgi:cytochrome c oxidase assembly protein subunit 15